MKLNELSALELLKLLKEGEVSSYEITDAVFKRIEERGFINAYINIFRGEALRNASKIDELYLNKKINDSQIIAGIPIAVKDNICYKGYPTTCGSRILSNFISPYDATVVKKIEDGGGIIIGKTNMDEFAMGSSNETSFFGPVLNPHHTEYVPGGSSGGSAAAVADFQAIFAIGSDTGGSIRQPASFCGIVGLKPTYGLVSRYGLVAFASSLDQIGPMARTVKDCALLLNVITGYDPKDSTSVNISKIDYLSEIENFEPKNFKIGLPKEYFIEGIDPEVKKAIDKVIKELEKEKFIIEETSLPHTEYAVADYYIIAPAEASSNLARYDGIKYGFRIEKEYISNLISLYFETRSKGFGDEVKRRILIGTYSLSSGYYDAYYLKALKVRRLIKEDFDKAFEKYDFLITPTSPTTAFKIGEKVYDPLKMYLSDIFTISANLAGLPAISVPIAKSKENLPIGLQILAPHFQEKKLLQISYFIENIVKEKEFLKNGI